MAERQAGGRLAGRSAVVTGSSSGIGRAIAMLLAAEGARVVVNGSGTTDASAAAIRHAVEEIRDNGGTAIGAAARIEDPDEAGRLIAQCVDTFGSIDILINNAAVFALTTVADCPLEQWRRTLDVNLDGVFHTSRHALPHMVAQRRGRIVTATSLAGLGTIGGSDYSASKAAVIGLGRAIAADYGPYGITSNLYSPEARTPMGETSDDSVFRDMRRRWVARGLETEAQSAYRMAVGGPEGVAPWVAYLCLDEAGHINGEVFAVEARRVALIAWPDETATLFRDAAAQGPWTLDELSILSPLAFPIANRWPQRTGAALEAWEKA